MRFDQLVVRIQGEELRLRFHPALTVLCGLSAPDRTALSDGILAALTGASETSALRYTDGTGRVATLMCTGGNVSAQYDDDGSPAPTPVGAVAPTAAALRALMVVRATDLGVLDHEHDPDEPAELREARATLADLTDRLDRARSQQKRATKLRGQLRQLDVELGAAREGEARRQYAQLLARLERVVDESTAVQSDAATIETDRRLLTGAHDAVEATDRWRRAVARTDDLRQRVGAGDAMEAAELDAAAAIPEQPPAHLGEAIEAAEQAAAERDALDQRLQELAVATLPAPPDPLVAELGVLDQDLLWALAERLSSGQRELERLQLAHGGFAVAESEPTTTPGAAPTVIREIEAAHAATDAAERAARATSVPGLASSGGGLAVAALGVIGGAPVVAGAGVAASAVAGAALLALPRLRARRARRAERAALDRADAPSYLSFHIRRVDAAIDPDVRTQVEAVDADKRRAEAAWVELVGPAVDVHHAVSLEADVRAYHQAIVELGGAADEIARLRRDLSDRVEPAHAAAVAAVRSLCEPFLLSDDDLADLPGLGHRVAARIDRGRTARQRLELQRVEADTAAAEAHLHGVLVELGFGEGSITARVEALDWQVSQARAREDDRSRARPLPAIEAERAELEEAVRRLHRPEWAGVTSADAAPPDIAAIEARRAEVAAQLAESDVEVDIDRLADRRAAVERRVSALLHRHGGTAGHGGPGAVADIQQHLLARLTSAGQSGPHADPVPVLLDEPFLHVPADRKWDLLDMLRRLAERHQLVYLSDDPFVAAWARQQAADGNLTLLEPLPS